MLVTQFYNKDNHTMLFKTKAEIKVNWNRDCERETTQNMIVFVCVSCEGDVPIPTSFSLIRAVIEGCLEVCIVYLLNLLKKFFKPSVS